MTENTKSGSFSQDDRPSTNRRCRFLNSLNSPPFRLVQIQIPPFLSLNHRFTMLLHKLKTACSSLRRTGAATRPNIVRRHGNWWQRSCCPIIPLFVCHLPCCTPVPTVLCPYPAFRSTSSSVVYLTLSNTLPLRKIWVFTAVSRACCYLQSLMSPTR